MTRNNTLNNVTELPQQFIQKLFGDKPHKVAVRLCAALKLTEKIKLLEVEGGMCPRAGDANVF